MFKEWRQMIDAEMSGRQAYRYAERIGQYHRIQASTGYREAAETVIKLLQREGIEAELVSYPARYGERYLGYRSFNEWHCSSAELWLEGKDSKRLARFQEEEISIVQRSIATPPEGITAEVVIIENATDPHSYQHVDLEGKIALVRGNQLLIYELAVEKHGAIGLIFDNLDDYAPVRTRMDMPDTIQYTSFWWQGNEKKAFGFAVSPRIGAELRQRCANEKVVVRATVDAQLYEGSFENIEYFIPGKTEKEILLVSHLCHPYPGGQDNASGPGTLMEVMRTLHRLMTKGKLQQPELGIRFLMMPEMTGTHAYFALHPERIPHTMAALNLDMVGADQTKGGGPLCIKQPPMSVPTFVDRFAYHLFEELAINCRNYTGTTKYSTVNYTWTRFSSGSDHYIISDPTIGIPCPMMIQWPDRHYHTTADTPDHLDPKMMKLVGTVTALYAYGLANGSEIDWLSFLMTDTARRYDALRESLEWVLQNDALKHKAKETFDFYVDYERKALDNILDYAKLRGFEKLAEKVSLAKQHINSHEASLLEWFTPSNTEEKAQQDDNWGNKVFQRVYPGPFRIVNELDRIAVDERIEWYMEEKSFKVPMGYDEFLLYWIDGIRSMNEVIDLTMKETGYVNEAYVKHLIDYSLKFGLIKENK